MYLRAKVAMLIMSRYDDGAEDCAEVQLLQAKSGKTTADDQ